MPTPEVVSAVPELDAFGGAPAYLSCLSREEPVDGGARWRCIACDEVNKAHRSACNNCLRPRSPIPSALPEAAVPAEASPQEVCVDYPGAIFIAGVERAQSWCNGVYTITDIDPPAEHAGNPIYRKPGLHGVPIRYLHYWAADKEWHVSGDYSISTANLFAFHLTPANLFAVGSSCTHLLGGWKYWDGRSWRSSALTIGKAFNVVAVLAEASPQEVSRRSLMVCAWSDLDEEEQTRALHHLPKPDEDAFRSLFKFNLSRLGGASCEIAASLRTDVRGFKLLVQEVMGVSNPIVLAIGTRILQPDYAPLADWVDKGETVVDVSVTVLNVIEVTRHVYHRAGNAPWGDLRATDEVVLDPSLPLEEQVESFVPQGGWEGDDGRSRRVDPTHRRVDCELYRLTGGRPDQLYQAVRLSLQATAREAFGRRGAALAVMIPWRGRGMD